MFVIAAALGSGGIFFRYAMNLSFTEGLHLDALLIQMLQVCNFNFILLPVMLLPKCETARQYSAFFSMFAAFTTIVSLPASFAAYEWYDVSVLNFWFNHVFAITLPIWMIVAGRLRPNRRYIPIVSGCVFCYFTLVYLITEALMAFGVLPEGSCFSYVYSPKGMPVLTQLYELIGVPYLYLLPVFFILVGIFYLWSMPFNRSVCFDFGDGRRRKRYGVIGDEIPSVYDGLERKGYALIGWSDDAADATAKYEVGSKIVVGTKNTVLYAVWKKLD